MKIRDILNFFISSPDSNYSTLGVKKGKYYRNFGLKLSRNKKKWKIPNKKVELKVNKAYQQAINNREFEINKFWSRAAYFWAFIVLIFGAYWQVRNESDLFLELLVICLGLIFSVAWYFVIKGSKHWQENWEAHIDALEDLVTGPIYKTIRYKGTFYSVSKINSILSIAIILTWVVLLIHFFTSHNFSLIPCRCQDKTDWDVLSCLAITLIFLCSIMFGYARKTFKNKKHRFIIRNK